MTASVIHLRILLPGGLFLEDTAVKSIVAETDKGSFGILPNRLDCAATLVPGILSYRTEEKGEMFVAVDAGILLKTGAAVVVSVRKATADGDLGDLFHAVRELFGNLDESQRAVRSVLARLEGHFIRQLIQFGHERPD